MKKICLLLFICSLLLNSCELFNTENEIKFIGSTSLTTKATYGDIVNGVQQILWEDNDCIKIISDYATTGYNGTGSNKHTYRLTPTRTEGSSSFAQFKIDNTNEDGLKWENNGLLYNFWSVYPDNVPVSDNGVIQGSTDHKYLMVAHTADYYNTNNKVFLKFYPAFTALQFNIDCPVDGVTITDCWIYSSKPLKGEFEGIIGNRGINNYNLKSSKKYASPDIIDYIYDGKSFTFFCLPQELSDIELTCYFTINGREDEGEFYKSIEIPFTFEECQKHIVALTLNSTVPEKPDPGNIDFSNLTLGGAQMLLATLKGNMNDFSNYARNKFTNDNEFWSFWNTFQNKPVNYFNDYVNNTNKDARDVFTNTSIGFNSFELELIKGFLETVTTYYHQNSLWASISASDFNFMPNIEYIQQLEVDPSKTNDYTLSIEIDGLINLKSVEFSKCLNVTIKNCPNITNISLINQDNNHEGVFTIDNCPITSFTQDWNGTNCEFIFNNIPQLQTITLHNAKSVTVNNCQNLTNFSMDNAQNLTNFSLSNTNTFPGTIISNAEKIINVYLNNCSNNTQNVELIFKGNNGNIVNAGKINSDNITVKYIDYGNNIKNSF